MRDEAAALSSAASRSASRRLAIHDETLRPARAASTLTHARVSSSMLIVTFTYTDFVFHELRVKVI
jgi:hypothetical protein